MKPIKLTLILILFAQISNAQIFDVDTLQYSGDLDKRINLVILSDGYQATEFSKFEADASDFNNKLFLEPPFAEYQDYFNVFIIKVPSNESGADHPGTATDVSEPAHPVQDVDNYFGSTFDFADIHRLLVAVNTFKISNVLANNFPMYDQTIILVNSPYYGGSGGPFPVASTEASSAEVAIHELGHSFGLLSDEYFAGDQFAGEAINMTQETNPALVKWKNWHGDNGIGIYQHCCGGVSANWYKPHLDCKMQFLFSPFCSVCREGLVERIHSLASPIDSWSPMNTSVLANIFPLGFKINLIEPNPNTLKSNWMLDGVGFANNVDTVTVEEMDLTIGINNLTAFVEDTTALLRVDSHNGIHLNSTTWMIDYSPVGIESILSKSETIKINLYPNPTPGILNIAMDFESPKEVRVDIVNAIGQVIKTLEEASFLSGVKSIELPKVEDSFFAGGYLD